MKIGTFNVGLLDAWVFGKKIFEFAPNTRERALALPQYLSDADFDFLFVQELYRQRDIDAVLCTTSTSLPFSYTAKVVRSQFLLGHGLALLSRHPITPLIDKRFDHQLADEGIVGPKGFLAAEADIPSAGRVLLLNMHTTAGGFFNHPESVKSNACRSAQLNEAITFASKYENAVVGGDFNCGPDVSVSNFSYLLACGYERPEKYTKSSDLPTWDPKNPLNVNSPHKTSPPQRIDHLLFSPVLSKKIKFCKVERIYDKEVAIGRQYSSLSDHYGLSVDFEFR